MDLINLIKSLPKCKLKRRKSDYLGFKMFQLFRILLCCIYAIITRHVDTWRLLLQMGTRARVLLVFMSLTLKWLLCKIHLISICPYARHWDKSFLGTTKRLSSPFKGRGGDHKRLHKITWGGWVHKKNTSLAVKGALAHCLQFLQHLTPWYEHSFHENLKNSNGRQGAPKLPMGSGKVSTPRFWGAPVNFL